MNLITLFSRVLEFIDRIVVPLIFAIAFIVFLWGIFVYFIQGGADEEKRAQGRQLALWSIIGFAIMLSVWGLVALLTNTIGINPFMKPTLPGSTGIPSGAQQQRNGFFGGGSTGGYLGGGTGGTIQNNTNSNSNVNTNKVDGAPLGPGGVINPGTNGPAPIDPRDTDQAIY